LGKQNCAGKPIVVVAFDFMTLAPQMFDLASRLTPAMSRLYPDQVVEDDEEEEQATDTSDLSKKIMSLPGAFAIKGIL